MSSQLFLSIEKGFFELGAGRWEFLQFNFPSRHLGRGLEEDMLKREQEQGRQTDSACMDVMISPNPPSLPDESCPLSYSDSVLLA